MNRNLRPNTAWNLALIVGFCWGMIQLVLLGLVAYVLCHFLGKWW